VRKQFPEVIISREVQKFRVSAIATLAITSNAGSVFLNFEALSFFIGKIFQEKKASFISFLLRYRDLHVNIGSFINM